MINLLPDEHKKEINAGRVNVLLVRYITMMAAAILVLGGLVGASYLVLDQTRVTAQERVDSNEIDVAEYKLDKDTADSFRSDLATAKTILDKEITYSKLIYKIANVIPRNVVLSTLTLDSEQLGSSASMTAKSKTFDDAVKLKEALVRNTQLFSDVSFEAVTNTESDSTSDSYPVTVNMKVTIKKEALE